jgi:hypothetical protein
MRGRFWFLAILLLSLATLPAWADIPPNPRGRPVDPPPPAAKDAKMIVELDPNAKEARLIVPRSVSLRRGALDTNDDTRVTEAEPAGHNHIVIAGLALALSLACGGLWLVRKNRLNSTGLALLLVVVAGVAGSAIVLANAPPPTSPRPLPPQPAPVANLVKLFDGKIKIETPAEGDTIKLVVPPDMLAGMAKEGLKANTPGNALPPPNVKPSPNEPK